MYVSCTVQHAGPDVSSVLCTLPLTMILTVIVAVAGCLTTFEVSILPLSADEDTWAGFSNTEINWRDMDGY